MEFTLAAPVFWRTLMFFRVRDYDRVGVIGKSVVYARSGIRR